MSAPHSLPRLALPLLLFLALAPREALAVWSASGNAVASTANVDETFRSFAHNASSVCTDGRGGMIVAWLRAGQDSLMVQRLDHLGTRRWNGSTGVRVSAATSDIPDNDIMPSVISDTDGGCWVAWRDTRAGAAGLYVQHLDADGVPQLAAGGLRITADIPPAQYKMPLALTASKKLLVGWVDLGTPDTVKVQRVRTTGALDWGTGLAVDVFDGGLLAPTLHRLFADGEGVVVLWEIGTTAAGNDYDLLHGSRLDANGTPQWGVDGKVVFNGAEVVGGPSVNYSRVAGVDAAWDPEQGLWVAWSRVPGGFCVQRVTLAGSLVIGDADSPVAIGSGNVGFDDVAVTTDGGSGLIVGWLSGTTNTSVYAQLVSSSGTELWGAGDVLVASGSGVRSQIEVESDAAGGAYLVYTDTSPGANLDDVVVKRLDESGLTLWTGLARTTSSSGAERAADAVPDGAGGLLLAWEDDRDAAASTLTSDLYAKHFEADGSLFVGSLTLTAPNGGSYESMLPLPITWNSNFGGEVMLTYTVAGGAPTTITTATPDDGALTWYPPPVSSSLVRVQVSIAGEPTLSDEGTDFRLCPTLNTTSLIASSVFTPYDLQTADFDEDGILDLAVAGASGVSALRGLGAGGVGNGGFGPAAVYAPGSARRLAVGDFDEDGILDLAVAHAAGVSTLRGDGTAGVGDGTFASAVAVAGLANAADVIAADFDNDGVLDLAAADSVGNRVAVFRGRFIAGSTGNGNGDFDAPVFFATGDQPMALAAGDFDLDGDLDLATANAGGLTVTLLRNTGASGFGTVAFTTLGTPTVPARPNVVALHDTDEDGDADLIVGTDLGLSLYRNGLISGVPFFETRVDLTLVPTYDLAVADLDRDGIEDLLTVGPAGAMFLFEGGGTAGAGNGVFTQAGALGTGGAVPGAIVMADFNEDGRLDAVFGNLSTHDLGRSLGGCNSIGASVPVLVTPDGGQVWTPNTLRSIQWTRPTALATVDLDVSRDGGANWEPIARRIGGTQYQWKVTHPVTDSARVRVRAHDYAHREDVSAADFGICGPYESVVTLPSATPPLDMVLLDVDRDGRLDLAEAVSEGFRIRRGLGAGGVGDGTFGPDTLWTTRDSCRALAVIDWDGQHGRDLILATDQGLEVRAVDAAGRFTPPAVMVIGADSRKYSALAVGDVDNDGDEDVVATSDSARMVVRFRKNGPGALEFQQAFWPIPARPSAVALADLDEDGDLDLLVSGHSGAGSLFRWLYTPGSGFLSPVQLASGDGFDLAVSDLNEDDIADVALVTSTGPQVVLGQGTGGVGNGAFGTATSAGSLTTGRRITTGDWNADGRIDLLVAGGSGFLGGNLRVYHGLGTGATGNGTFARDEMLYTALLPTPILFADVLEDDRLDLLIGLSNQVAVLHGACATPPAPLTLTSPVGGEAVAAGVLRDIRWTKPATGHPVDLELSLDDGATWEPLANEATGTRHRWNPPQAASQGARLRVLDARLRNVSAATAYAFVIYTDPLDAGGTPGLTAVSFAAPSPNPSRGRTRFALTLPVAGEARVELFDLAGRRVRTLAAGPHAAGEHRLDWDGRDDSGRIAGPGVYMARARAGAFEHTQRFVRLD